MQRQNERPLNVHALLKSTGTPFTVAHYPPRATLFLQGDACESLMFIEKGRVWLTVTAPAGKQGICGVLAAGAFLGDEVLAGHAFRRQTATAMTATEVLERFNSELELVEIYYPSAAHEERHGAAVQAALAAGGVS